VRCQRLDDPALRNPPALAGPDHALHFAPKLGQPLNFCIDVMQVTPGDGVNLAAGLVRPVGQFQKLPDAVDVEPKVSRMANEG
jgi:hypothetical protein